MVPHQNHLIARLPQADRRRLLAACEPVELRIGQALGEPGSATRHVYFPTDSFISLVTRVDSHPGLEVGMVGREGMLGVQLALGVARAPLRALVQGAGPAWRLGAAGFRRELAASPALRRGLNAYLYVLMAQLSNSASCLRFHLIGPRLARWLLMSQDRAHAERFHITHEFLAYMLGVRRVGVTMAAGVLQGEGLIRYQRGELTVLDRQGLEAAACSCYAINQGVYARLLG
ncbi:Crp/Fnr family transcriptional regulator [Roseateles violae]|uniref:Crp/Fnr family transcriptional regulator n=1 Tax=Roseateles violae TaxID=3058042 RepID=A0ABT8E0E3_9BURK|nr:Crp/Fnr family transcriptional regulator [Pelomonas sp. PFR6]MDN3923264.1 Crp/Fnr family transcriptional regulator [Pelomonas sp. PFR6]